MKEEERMSDRIKGVVVTFDEDIRDDDFEATIGAIRMIRGVLSVEPSVLTIDDHMNRERIRAEFAGELVGLVRRLQRPVKG